MKLSEIKNTLCIKDHLYGRRSSAKVQVGSWEIKTSQSVDEDRNYYSKGWHKTYGAKFTVSDRAITFRRKHGRGYINKNVCLTSWSGNYIENAVVSAGLAPKNPTTPLSVRLHKAFDAVLIKTLRGHKIYQRTLFDQPVDYVIVAPMGTTFHSDNYSDLIRGLYKKIRAAATTKLTGDKVDWSACKSLNFCDEGIKQFCNTFNLSIKKSYTLQQIERAVRSDLPAASPFRAELLTLAAAYNYSVQL